MKQQLFKNLSLLLTTVFFASCSLEDEYVAKQQYQQSSKYSIERKSLKELLQDQKFSTAFNKLPKQNVSITTSVVGRTVMEQDYGFTISENIPAQVMSTEYLTSYTFYISRSTPSIDFFENLVVQTDTLGTTKAYVVKYSLNTPVSYFAEHDSYIVDGQRELTTILYNANEANAKIQYVGDDDCTLYTLMCPYGHPHPASLICVGEGQDVYWVSDNSNCAGSGNNSGDGGSTGDSGASNPGSDSGTGGSGDTPDDNGGVVTLPLPVLEEDLGIIPCDKLKNLVNLPEIQTELSNMSNKTSELTEWGRYKLTGTNVVQTPPSTSAGEVSFPATQGSQKYVMMAHTHNSPAASTYSVFSWGDLVGIATMIKNNMLDNTQFTAFLATADGTYYALTIENPVAFQKFFYFSILDSDYDAEEAKKKIKERNKYYDPKFTSPNPPIIRESNTNNLADEEAFLQLLQDNNLGATLFEANAGFTTFKEITYNKKTKKIDKTPCL